MDYLRNLLPLTGVTYDGIGMGFQALLFCPDEKPARAVTQVLTELEFTVESCNEPFAAVKKLMGAHFDAIVVDCDNEQNATLLFKSARNSTSNQSSLAVAVVEGQAGVARAFRIGANLVLTKPINIEQAKGTLRVARGLLRKGDSGKPAAPAASAAKAATGAASAPMTVPASAPSPVKTGPVLPSAKLPPATLAEAAAAVEAASTIKHAAPPAAVSSSGAAAAPAREILDIPPLEALPARPAGEDDDILESPDAAERAKETPPAFTFGGANLPAKSGAGKKIVLGIVAAAIVAAGLYFGWTYYQAHKTQPVSNPESSTLPTQPEPRVSGTKPAAALPTTAKPDSQPTVTATTPTTLPATRATDDSGPASDEDLPKKPAPSSAKHAGSASSVADESAPAEKPAAAPLVVKGGAAPKMNGKAAAADAPAPSVIGIAAPDSSGPLPDLGGPTDAPRPLLQKLNISQGVSQGLLIKKVNPVYPTNALRLRIEGSVQLEATISKDGDITNVQVLSGDKQLSSAAVDAVKRWKYKPYLLNGEPVEIQTQVTVSFKLPH
jgi:periplasmic protein TonB